MTRLFVLSFCLITLSIGNSVCAQEHSFSHTELAEMGLSGITVISDYEASTIRVRGSYPRRWGYTYPFIYGISRLEDRSIRAPRPVYPLRTGALLRARFSRL